MRDHLLQVVGDTPPEARRNLAREYLQVYLLRLLHEAGAFRPLAFVGGTALRLLHRLPRFSEDLDFSAATAAEPLDAERLFRGLKAGLEAAGYRVGARARSQRAVASAFFRFEGLTQALGWSDDPRLALAVKIEVDLRPPDGARLETTLVQRFFPVALRHHDLPSLFAGKLHALLARPWAKGRDWFDLAWYLTEKRGTEPNLALLANALAQTGGDPSEAPHWREAVRERLRRLHWATVERDVAPFAERREDLRHLSREAIEKLL
ncbi:MAG: nucleotidyl transferase AbiEii/AbiGii toxin family protein [Deltaproteobacteria bacterium]|nr:nucleotidyl transferase AbiEii/AbiGii toxin family protein [Deltaproteobacteria bacterium]